MADTAETGGGEQDDISFLRTEDIVCLSCLATSARENDSGERFCLAAEGFGNRICSLSNISNKDVPPDMSVCAFVLEQALSVRALQEMVTSSTHDSRATQSGHRTLLYGHAVLLRHLHSSMYLSCLSTSSSNDKLAFDVGLQEMAEGESCWWTIHPASKQRSEGEKVRVGDDLILVSVSSERYLHIGYGVSVIASFQQTLWTVVPMCSGAIRLKSLGYVFGGDVLRLFHGHMDECLTIPPSGSENEHTAVMYETGAVCSHARSLWRLEHIRTKWAGGFLGWGSQCRIRHITSGRYLAIHSDNQVVTVHRNEATEELTTFLLVLTKDEKKQSEGREDEGMGKADIKYGDSMTFIQHCASGLWLSYMTYETKKRGIGRVEEKKAVLLQEGHMDDAFTLSRAQEEESRSARVIRKCQSLFHRFNKALDSLKTEGRTSNAWARITLEEVLKSLEDLIEYFAQPGEDEEHEERQSKLKALRNRQDLFQEEGMIALVLETIDKFIQYKSRRHFAHYAGEEAAEKWDDISSYLYLLLAAMIRGNRANCAQFAQSYRLDWLVSRLESQQSSTGVLDVLHCVLIDSPEALNMIKEKHIVTIISLIDKHGRDPKVLDVLKSLCVGNGIAVRTNQNLICDNLLPGRDLLLQTKLVDHVTSMKPNIYIGLLDGSAMYRKWYFEVVIAFIEQCTHQTPVLRIGWGNTEGFIPYPGGGEHWGANGVGDDLYSYAFDGVNLWTGGRSKQVRHDSQVLEKGHIIGCALDLTVPQISFTVNGNKVHGVFKDFNTDGMFFPVVSMSARVSVRFMLGGEHGRLKFNPPEGHSPVYESLLPREKLKIEPCFYFGEQHKNIISGTTEIMDFNAFVPNPVDTTHVQLPAYIENVRDKLAENIHELWSMNKVDQGWTYGEVRDDPRKKHPCLCTFEQLPISEKKYDITLAFETLRTLLALGYHITIPPKKESTRLKMVKLGSYYLQSNGYKPCPLDLNTIVLNEKMEELVDLLAENTHNVWAKDRIKQGWTYGLCEDNVNKRSPYLVPYNKVDEHIKKANRDTASETVKTLMAYGYNLEPPTNEGGDSGSQALTLSAAEKQVTSRTYRAELTYAVTSGKWYYEFEVITPGYMRLGWAKASFDPGCELGTDGSSYGFDGFLARKWFQGSAPYGKCWQAGDVIGCMLDMNDNIITFSLNGELMMDALGQEIAFRDINTDAGYVPAFTLGAHQQARINFGQDINKLKYFTCYGLQEGYEPFCVNMTRQMTLWYAKNQPVFEPLTSNHSRLEAVRIPGGTNITPALKISSKNFGTLEQVCLEYVRLSLPVTCMAEFVSKDKSMQSELERKMNLENIRRHEMDIEEERNAFSDVPGQNYSDANISDASVEKGSKVIADTLKRIAGGNSESSTTESHREGSLNISDTTEKSDVGTEDDFFLQRMNGGPDLTLRKTLHRGFTDDESVPDADQRRTSFLRNKAAHHSLDESTMQDPSLPGMKSAASESQLVDGFLGVEPERKKSSSKLSLLADKINESKAAKAGKTSKSPFATLFRRSKSREPSPTPKDAKSKTLDSLKPGRLGGRSQRSNRSAASSQNLAQKGGDPEGAPAINIEGPDGLIPYEFQDKDIHHGFSNASMGSDYEMSEAEMAEMNAMTESMHEYYYSVRIFPGQDPNQVYVGWVTPGFHMGGGSFDMKKIRNVIISTQDTEYKYRQSVSRKNCYMVCAGALQQRYGGTHEESSKKSSPGLVIGCFIDTATGILSFSVNGKEVANKYQVEPGTNLFPAVVFEPTIKEMFQFELGRTKNTLPLSAALFRGPKHIQPACPPRLDLQVMKAYYWARVPNTSLKAHSIKMSEVRGWSLVCEEPVSMMAVYIPEEDSCLDILELIEYPALLNFHARTLDLYQAVCSHGNHRVAHALTKHVDDKQLFYCIESEYMSGPLRHGFHALLVAMHMDYHAKARMMTQNEYIIPRDDKTKNLCLYRKPSPDSTTFKIKYAIPKMEESVSIRPCLYVTERQIEDRAKSIPIESLCPFYPMDKLKKYVIYSMNEAVVKGAAHIRDPIGGSNENLFVPLLKVCDNLLVMGLLDDEDLLILLSIIDPASFDPNNERVSVKHGLLSMQLAEAVKLEVCRILQHLCDSQLRHRVESIVAFSDEFVGSCQKDQLWRYNAIKQSDLPSAVTAKKTREFRCPPQEQMKNLLKFKCEEEYDEDICACRDDLRDSLLGFHKTLMLHCDMPTLQQPEEPVEAEPVEEAPGTMRDRLKSLIWKVKKEEEVKEKPSDEEPKTDSLQRLIAQTMVRWGEETFISDQNLVREMFSLLHRQYDGVAELLLALEKAYAISSASRDDINQLLKALGHIRSLLLVQVAVDEEESMKTSLKELMDNKVFFQHPDLMRALCVHETVMQLMVNTLNKSQQQQQAAASEQSAGNRQSIAGAPNIDTVAQQSKQDAAAEMVVMCCRFLCYFCRISRQNQRAMFEHLSYLLENSSMLLARPSLRGSCPLDVAYSSLMDNNELALALRESNLERITVYLSRCGLQSNAELLEKGYPDIGWDPVEGERYLDFFRFCVWVNGESVEENANLVVRLLIRRPECLGPALRGEGGGLLKATRDGIKMSEQIAASKDTNASNLLTVINDDDDTGGEYLFQSKYDFSALPPDDDEDYIDMGGAILNFYSSLVDLLGRCAPDAETIKAGRSNSLRARAILRSLVSMEDLEGVLGLRFILPTGFGTLEEGVPVPLPPGLLPAHKAAIVLFLERVYGIPDRNVFFKLLEDGFLPDLRAATTLDEVSTLESDMALALNRYLCNSVLPLMTSHCSFFRDADHVSALLDNTLNTVYRYTKCRSLTKGQRDVVCDFLVAFTRQLRPPMMTKLLRKMTVDVPALSDSAVVPLRLLTSHYERCGSYYGSHGGWGSFGSASEEERRLTMVLFSGIFDSLAQRGYDPELFSRALPCLSAIGCAMSPDYSLTNQDGLDLVQGAGDAEYIPNPVNTKSINLNPALEAVIAKFSEHYHDCWAVKKVDQGWVYGADYDEDKKQHPMLKPYQLLTEREKYKYTEPVRESLKCTLALGWVLDCEDSRILQSGDGIKRRASKSNVHDQGYSPRPYDLRNMTVTREMQTLAERVAENTHQVWAKQKKEDLEAIGGGIHPLLVPYDNLTDREKRRDKEHAQELLKFLQFLGFRIACGSDISKHAHEASSRHGKDADGNALGSSTEKRFAYSLLQKLLEYLDKASVNMQQTKPSSRFSRRESYSQATEDVKFFGKVVLPFVERYFHAHRLYFIASPTSPSTSGMASSKEKEMTATLFCKLAQALRSKINAFGHDVNISVRCLQVLVQAVDARSVVKNSPEIIRAHFLPFFNNAAADLANLMDNLNRGRFSHVKGTITRGATSLNYVHMVLLPVLSSFFEHLGHNSYGNDILVGEIQLACYRILNALFSLGTSGSAFIHRETISVELARHRPVLGECMGAFASCFPVAFLEPTLNRYNKHSVMYGIEGSIAEHSLEAQEVEPSEEDPKKGSDDVMESLADSVPNLDVIITEIDKLADSGGDCQDSPHIMEVTLPMLCSYLPFWWSQGPDNVSSPDGNHVTTVTATLMNAVLGKVLSLILNNVSNPSATWMNRIASRVQPIIGNSTPYMVEDHFLPIAKKIQSCAEDVETNEKRLSDRRSTSENPDLEGELQELYSILVRDLYAFYPLLIKYVDLHRSSWLKSPIVAAEELFNSVAYIFTLWSRSLLFKREEQNFVSQNEIDNMALIMPSQAKGLSVVKDSDDKGANTKKDKKRLEAHNSLNVACLKRLFPIGLSFFSGREQELLQHTKERLIKDPDGDIETFLAASLETEEGEVEPEQWQKLLFRKIGDSKLSSHMELDSHKSTERILAMARVMFGLHLVEHPSLGLKGAWRKVISSQRKRAVMACFRMVPLYGLPRHRAMNLFLKAYRIHWLGSEEVIKNVLIEDLTVAKEEEEEGEKKEAEEVEKPDPLSQLIVALCRGATKEQSDGLGADELYMAYADIMSKSCHGEDEDDDDDGGDDATTSLQEQEMEKQQLLSEQSRLSERGAAEMILLYISATKGVYSPIVDHTIELGISLLRGGNVDVQNRMLKHLKDKKDVGFFTSVAGLMQQCSVLDLDAFERCNKAEGLGMSTDTGPGEKNLHDAEFTCKLFRFLQLLCEGHNLEFQNYLRTQAGNNTTVNIIICTVDYLLRLQESIMDFYWHYSGKEIIDPAGKANFCRAILVAKYVFRSLTEYIQGPCAQNQLALAHSRLWDAVGGFLYIFAQMQDKLSKDFEQLELLREFMNLQKEMMIMLLSMLEGNVMHGPIGKQMVDTLVESSGNVEMILKFFDIFLKMKNITSSEAFLDFDINKDGSVSLKEFRTALESQKVYSNEEIDYIMMCVDADQDGKVDYDEFTERFHNPAKDIGFTMAVLLTNLSEHSPNDPRLERFLEKARSVLDYFEPYLGRIEIMGSANRIERIYFEIKQSQIDQWEKPQIKESKRSFLHSVINEGGDKEKLESFVNFCEDTIFEMQHATSITGEELKLSSALGGMGAGGILEPVKVTYRTIRDFIGSLLSFFTWSNIKNTYHTFRGMTYGELSMAFLKGNVQFLLMVLTFIFNVFWTLAKFLINMMMGDRGLEAAPEVAAAVKTPPAIMAPPLALGAPEAPPTPKVTQENGGPGRTFPTKKENGLKESVGVSDGGSTVEAEPTAANGSVPWKESAAASDIPTEALLEEAALLSEPEEVPKPEVETPPVVTEVKEAAEEPAQSPAKGEAAEEEEGVVVGDEEIPYETKAFDYGKYILSYFARNFYNFKYVALALAFFINFILLFYKVNKVTQTIVDDDAGNGTEDDDDANEVVIIEEDVDYLVPILEVLAILHSLASFSMLVAYYCLKVPLVIFKREKEIARKLEFEGLYIAEQPDDDDIKAHWDKLVLSTSSFPQSYWDKFVKKKVRIRYAEQYDYESISNLLGMKKGDSITIEDTIPHTGILPTFISEMDWQYQLWKWGVIFTDNSFLYILWYFIFSVLGNFNHFFFAAHLIDVAIGFKTLRTILQSVTHNGKQLVLTVMLTSIVVYIYTVIAFNFFRKFYVKEEDGQVDKKCHDMATCFIYHLHTGLRAGGGIGDEIEPADGDPSEAYRIIFDITFFFFIIVILLAIIQGLIIDAFGELRDQLEQVKEDMESKCFICGIGKEFFDKVPHGFDTHVMNEHNFANYMFFLMHLINKPDTEYTGQETYVWEMYQQRCWDFFPVGDCFRKQYEDEASS